MPGEIHSIGVGAFDNESRQVGLEKILAMAFERELYERGPLPVREDPREGDGILTGTIRTFKIKPVAFDANDVALQFEAEMTVDVTLRRQADGKVLWRGSRMRAVDDYAVNPLTAVPTSSQFQQGTIDRENLAQLSAIQLAETEKREAIGRMVNAIVRDVQDRMLDDF